MLNTIPSNSKVSVVTVCLNSENHLETAIRSVLSQTYKDIEYIIIDGGSTDNTLNIIRKYEGCISRWFSERDKGVFDAMNKGINAATGDILYFLNSDDYLKNESVIEKVVDFLKQEKGADFIYGDLEYYDSLTNRIWRKRYPDFIRKHYFLMNSIGHPATFFRSSCFKKAGFYDTDLKIAGDFEWFLKALYKTGLKAAHVKLTICVFRLGGFSSHASYAEKHLKEVRGAQKPYFNSLEIWIGSYLNIILSGEVFRRITMFIIGRKAYDFLKGVRNRYE